MIYYFIYYIYVIYIIDVKHIYILYIMHNISYIYIHYDIMYIILYIHRSGVYYILYIIRYNHEPSRFLNTAQLLGKTCWLPCLDGFHFLTHGLPRFKPPVIKHGWKSLQLWKMSN